MHRFLFGVALLALACWLPSSVATAQYGATTAAPPTYVQPACPPVVSPPPVVVEPPRRCCVLRLCDWLCGRPAPQPTVVAMPVVPTQPSCGCNPCACGNCQTMPAPSLTSYNASPANYTASAPTTYQAAYPVQQSGYAQPVTTFQPVQQVVYPSTSRRAPPRWPGP